MDLLLVQSTGQLGDALLIELVQAIVQPDRTIAELACAIIQGGHAVIQGLGAIGQLGGTVLAEWAPSAAVATPLVYWLTLDTKYWICARLFFRHGHLRYPGCSQLILQLVMHGLLGAGSAQIKHCAEHGGS